MAAIAPSILGADFAHLEKDIRRADECGIDMFHLDIMDGHFAPNISFGPGIVKTINSVSETYLDVHLMLSEPEKYFEAFAKAGANSITFHIEARPDPRPLVKQIRDLDCQTGISLNPDTPVDRVLPYLEEFDLLLVMSVFPGFGGQSFIESALDTIAAAREYIDKNGLDTRIQVDGGVDGDNARKIVEAGADILVMGTAFFGSQDLPGLVRKVKSLHRSSHGSGAHQAKQELR